MISQVIVEKPLLEVDDYNLKINVVERPRSRAVSGRRRRYRKQNEHQTITNLLKSGNMSLTEISGMKIFTGSGMVDQHRISRSLGRRSKMIPDYADVHTLEECLSLSSLHSNSSASNHEWKSSIPQQTSKEVFHELDKVLHRYERIRAAEEIGCSSSPTPSARPPIPTSPTSSSSSGRTLTISLCDADGNFLPASADVDDSPGGSNFVPFEPVTSTKPSRCHPDATGSPEDTIEATSGSSNSKCKRQRSTNKHNRSRRPATAWTSARRVKTRASSSACALDNSNNVCSEGKSREVSRVTKYDLQQGLEQRSSGNKERPSSSSGGTHESKWDRQLTTQMEKLGLIRSDSSSSVATDEDRGHHHIGLSKTFSCADDAATTRGEGGGVPKSKSTTFGGPRAMARPKSSAARLSSNSSGSKSTASGANKTTFYHLNSPPTGPSSPAKTHEHLRQPTPQPPSSGMSSKQQQLGDARHRRIPVQIIEDPFKADKQLHHHVNKKAMWCRRVEHGNKTERPRTAIYSRTTARTHIM